MIAVCVRGKSVTQCIDSSQTFWQGLLFSEVENCNWGINRKLFSKNLSSAVIGNLILSRFIIF